MLEEERRDVGEEKAKADIPEGMSQLASLASLAEVPARGSVEPVSPAVEDARPGVLAEAAEDSIEEGSFPEEPFEEPLHKPRLIGTGKAKGRRLVKPDEPPQPSLPRMALLSI